MFIMRGEEMEMEIGEDTLLCHTIVCIFLKEDSKCLNLVIRSVF